MFGKSDGLSIQLSIHLQGHTHTHTIYIYILYVCVCVRVYIYIFTHMICRLISSLDLFINMCCVFPCIYIYYIYRERERDVACGNWKKNAHLGYTYAALTSLTKPTWPRCQSASSWLHLYVGMLRRRSLFQLLRAQIDPQSTTILRYFPGASDTASAHGRPIRW